MTLENSNALDGVILERDVVYNQDPKRPLTLHLLRPQNMLTSSQPAIVYSFGGAFKHGSKDSGIERLIPFARRGYVCVSIEYRLSGEVLFPAPIQDCKCAIRFLRANRTSLGIDPDRIGSCGHSSGGYMATMLGVSEGVAAFEGEGGWVGVSSRVQAVCDWYGPTDFLHMDRAGSSMCHDTADSPESLYIGGPIQEYKDRVVQANPITYVTPDRRIPPSLIIHGDQDPLVPFNQSELLVEAFAKVGADYRFHPVLSGGHGGELFETPEVTRLVEDFFDSRLSPNVPREGNAGIVGSSTPV